MKRRVFFWCGLASIGLVLLAVVFAYWTTGSPPGPVDSGIAEGVADAPSPKSAVPQEVSREDAVKSTLATGSGLSRSRSSVNTSAAAAPSEVSPQVRELMTRLTEIALIKGAITPEQAERWKQTLAEIIAQGAPAVPGIREFLAKNEDIDFGRMLGGILLGQPSMRVALIKTLKQIGGPEAEELMAETMGTSAVPVEITLLANYLDEAAPGQYRKQAADAVGQVIGMASQGKLPGLDVGPLMHLLQGLDATTLKQTAEKLESQYGAYTAITLANLEGGAGLPSILRYIDNPAPGVGPGLNLEYQMLAQMAPQSPEAGAALLQRARSGQISDAAWTRIAMGLAGDQYQMYGFSADGQPEIPNTPGLKLFHLESGNQNYYSLPLAALATPEQVDQRRRLIDQLLAANPGPHAVRLLKQARANLPHGMASN